MNRRALITLLSGAAVAWPLVANAQQGEQMRRIGLLLAGDQDDPIRQSQLAALLEGLRVLGWEQGRNIQIEQRWGGADEKRFQAYAAELTDVAPDVILANTTQQWLHCSGPPTRSPSFSRKFLIRSAPDSSPAWPDRVAT